MEETVKPKVTWKRFWAFLIDMVIVLLISSLLSEIKFINPNYEQYQKVYDEYMDIYEEYSEIIISGEETKESQEIIKKINDLSYEMSKNTVIVSVINIVCLFLYFVVFQYYNKGQTVGKALLKIKVVDEENKKPKFTQLLTRSLIINSILTTIITTIAIVSLTKNVYLDVVQVIQLIDMALIYGSIAFMIFRLDGKGIHDLVAKTQVVHLLSIEEEKKEVIEKPKTKKSSTKQKQTKVREVKVKEK